MTEDEFNKKKEVRDDIRKTIGDFTAEEIAEQCLELLKTKSHLFLKNEFPDADENNLDEAVYIVTRSPKYMPDVSPYNKRWLIKRNPNYRNEFLHDVKIAAIAALLTLLTGYILLRLDSQSKSREMERATERLEQVEHRLDSLSK